MRHEAAALQQVRRRPAPVPSAATLTPVAATQRVGKV